VDNPAQEISTGHFGGQRRRLLVFIATGDTCRSPMAAGYLRKLLDERGVPNIEIRSAGVMTVTGLRASQEAVQILQEEGVDLDRHRSSQLTEDLIRRASLILGMTPFHVQRAMRINDDARHRTFLFKEFVGMKDENIQIADPMGQTLEVFKKCFREVKEDFFKKRQPPARREAPAAAKPAAKPKPAKDKSTGKRAAKKEPGKKTTARSKGARKQAPSKKSGEKKASKKKAPVKKRLKRSRVVARKPAKRSTAKSAKRRR
jgi:protein-tyrosine-phosphatase